MYLDIVVYTCVERFVFLENTVLHAGWELMKVPACTAYVENFRNHPVFKDHVMTRKSFALHTKKQMECAPGEKYGLPLSLLDE